MASEITGCVVYKMGEAPETTHPLSEAWGWIIVIGFGMFFTAFTMFITSFEQKALGQGMTSENFNTAGRSVRVGLTAAVIVSQWTWAATLLMSSNMGWRVGVSGPFWYASGATIQILLFAVLAIQVKRRASHMHTFMEIVKARFGTGTHLVMIVFALMANMIVTAMLLLGGSATIADLTGMSSIWAAFLIPLLSCWIYTMHGGLRATFFASYVHTTVIFLMLLVFTFAVYGGSGDGSNLFGTPGKVYNGLQSASAYGHFSATISECEWLGNCAGIPQRTPGLFSSLGSTLQNDGTCFNSAQEDTGRSCSFQKRGSDESCCTGVTLPSDGSYCRANDRDCIDVSDTEHFSSEECDFAAGERCVTSYLTMGSWSGLLFGITNIVGNFGTVFVDQSYWQSAVAARPKSAVYGFLVGGMVWFAVPFCMATTNGLAGRALTMHPDLGTMYIDAGASGSGLTPARVLSHILGGGGAFILLLQLFMAITSTGSAEIIAVSSIMTYDVYLEYLNPELKQRREGLRRVFYGEVARFQTGSGSVALSSLQALLDALVSAKFFHLQPAKEEVILLTDAINNFAENGDEILVDHLYDALNRAVSSNSLEGIILLRVSKFFTGIFALFMGFLAVFLQTLGFGLGWVYMSMGVLIGSAVGPASLTILMERANGKAIAAGAIGGLVMGMSGWFIQAAIDSGEITYNSLGKDVPWVVGNLCAIFGGLFIALGGSLAFPDKDFRWEMLNKRIPLVDDIEPPKDSEESEEKLKKQVWIAVGASVVLTFILIILWPLPMYAGAGVFSEGGFTTWVTLEIIWALIAGLVIIFLPAFETIQDFLRAKKLHENSQRASFSMALKNGTTLSITVPDAPGNEGMIAVKEKTADI